MTEEIYNSSKEKLDYEFDGNPSDTSFIVIIGHGLTEDKDCPWAIALVKAFSNLGVNSIRFSFSGSGNSEGKFEDYTTKKAIKDLKAVIDAAENQGYHRICYVGHSIAGVIGVLSGIKDLRIGLLISLSSMVYTKKFCEDNFDVNSDKGDNFVRGDKKFPISTDFIADMTKLNNILSKTEKIEVPWLILHGDNDDIIDVDHARDLYRSAYEPKDLEILEGVNHSYDGEGLSKMIDAVTNWIKPHVI